MTRRLEWLLCVATVAGSPPFAATQQPSPDHEPTSPTPALPPRALISGVPFIVWGDAARLDYHDKNILNPSVPASHGMILEYRGLDRHLVEHSLDAPQGWPTASSEGGTLDSVRSYVARGMRIMVMQAMTQT